MDNLARTLDRHAGDVDEYERIVASRRTCRGYLPEPLPRALIERILRIAQQTASWNNVQPWRVDIVSGRAIAHLREMLLEVARSKTERASHFPFPEEFPPLYLERRRACGFALYAAVGVARGDKEAYARQMLKNYEFFGAPHVAIVSTDEKLGVYGAVDCGGYVTNFMQAAEALSVGTTAQGALANYAEYIHRHLELPASQRIVCGISFGWPDKSHPSEGFRTDRAPIEDVVHWVDG